MNNTSKNDSNGTAWTRHGDCNHCGYCCQFLGRVNVEFEIKDDLEFCQARGISPKGLALVDLLLPCPKHINGRCSIHETKPKTCQLFPVQPEQIEGTPCSYWFTNEQGETKGGQGAPPEILAKYD